MKRKLVVLFVAVFALTAFTLGCSGGETSKQEAAGESEKVEAASIEQISDLQGKDIGMIMPAGSQEGLEEAVKVLIGGEPNMMVYFNRYVDAVTATKTGKIDAVLMPSFVSDFYIQRNNDLKVVELDKKMESYIIMAVRSEDQKLKEDLDAAIAKLQEDGMLESLESEWITNLSLENEPMNKEMGKIEGAPTIYVGISGDMAPLDYIGADGMPAGFNVAMLTEVGKIMNVNFEFVSMETQARFTALTSKKIDLIFCHFQGDNAKFIKDLENQNWIGTIPYYKYDGISAVVKK